MNLFFFLTSDDGYYSKGFRILLDFFKNKNLKYFSIVPEENKSGISHAISLNKSLKVKKKEENVYVIKGTPVDAVLLTLFGGLVPEKPDIIISGINRGYNLGLDVLYSGTVASVREGFIYGISGISISIGDDEYINFDTAIFYFEKILDYVIKNFKNLGKFLWNINIPNVKKEEIKGIEWTKLGKVHYLNPVEIIEKGKEFKLGGKMKLIKEEGTDVSAILSNKISITPLNILGEEKIEKERYIIF
ncbi:MAG: 5'/3'-nucleotidase SurE [candidate division WOR-3 bacterium]